MNSIKQFFKKLNKGTFMNVTSISGGTIKVNGKTYKNLNSGNLSISDGIVTIDGKRVDDFKDEQIINVVINVVIDGDVKGNVETNGDVTCKSAGSIQASSGTVECGSVHGSVQCSSGDVEVTGDVSGGIQTSSGNIKCGAVTGDVNTISGNIKHR